MLGIFRNLKSRDVWKTLQDHWKMYQKKHHNRCDTSQDDNLRRPDEECEESNKEDWMITVEEEEQCDGIEIPSSDNEGKPTPNKQKISIGAFE